MQMRIGHASPATGVAQKIERESGKKLRLAREVVAATR